MRPGTSTTRPMTRGVVGVAAYPVGVAAYPLGMATTMSFTRPGELGKKNPLGQTHSVSLRVADVITVVRGALLASVLDVFTEERPVAAS